MDLSDNAIKEFQHLYKKHFGKSISYAQAKSDGLLLIKLISRIQPTNMEMDNSNVKYRNS